MQLTRTAGLHYTLLHFMEDWDVFSYFCAGVDMLIMLKTLAALQVLRLPLVDFSVKGLLHASCQCKCM